MSEIETRLDASEKFFKAAEDLYWEVKDTYWQTFRCEGDKKAERASYEELRQAFLPTRTKETVQRACDKIARSAEDLFANTEIFRGDEPTCKSLGLDEKSTPEEAVYNTCYFTSDKGKVWLVCDCPDGYAGYTPEEFAKEYVVKCLDDEGVWMHYSDNPEKLEKGYRQYVSARKRGDVNGMVLGCDAMVNAIHGSGPLARVFVVSGARTLHRLAEAVV